MPGIPRDVVEHSLDIRAGARPVKQTLRHFDEEKRRAIGEEIHKLLAAGFIKEVVGVSDPGGGGPLDRPVKSLRAPAQMGWRGMEHKRWNKPCIILHQGCHS
jgi:hypothetical protein